jgi:sugar porter (SP) family MFS transporter
VRNPDGIEAELDIILSQHHGPEGPWTEVFAPEFRPALVIGIGLPIFQQITGINTIIYYAPTIFQLAGFSSAAQSILATAGVGVVNVIMTIVSLRLLDRIGRRPLLLTGIAGMTLSLITLGWVFRARDFPGASWFAVASVMLYVGAFAISLGPIFWLLISEIYPLRIRGVAMGIATMSNWTRNMLVTLTFLVLLNDLGPARTFWLYGLLSAGAFIFSYRRVPETKGRALEEIEA